MRAETRVKDFSLLIRNASSHVFQEMWNVFLLELLYSLRSSWCGGYSDWHGFGSLLGQRKRLISVTHCCGEWSNLSNILMVPSPPSEPAWEETEPVLLWISAFKRYYFRAQDTECRRFLSFHLAQGDDTLERHETPSCTFLFGGLAWWLEMGSLPWTLDALAPHETSDCPYSFSNKFGHQIRAWSPLWGWCHELMF